MSSTTSRRPVAVDLFCGAGGLSLGFEQAGFDVLAAVDHDPVHLAVHLRNFPKTSVACDDISSVSRARLESLLHEGWAKHDRSGVFDGRVDCVFGGPSCQGFSEIGKRDVDDERNALVFSFARVVSDIRPRSFVMENVPGLMAPKSHETLNRLLKVFSESGYHLVNSGPIILDASDFGVPQNRRRAFLIGFLDPAFPFRLPDKSRYSATSVRDALVGLPTVSTGRLVDDRRHLTDDELRNLDEGSTYSDSLRRRRGAEYLRNWERKSLTGHGAPEHTPDVIERFAALQGNQRDKPSRALRLALDGRSPTLRAGTGLDHGSFTAVRPVHPLEPRAISVREAARLHSFPDWFDFHVTKWHALRQIGNSVPPRLAEAVGRSIASTLGVDPGKPKGRLSFGPDSLRSMTAVVAADHFGYDPSLLPKDVRTR